MVRNNASTSYDVTDKSITPLVSGRGMHARVGTGRTGLPRELRAQRAVAWQRKPVLLPCPLSLPLQTASFPTAVRGCGGQ